MRGGGRWSTPAFVLEGKRRPLDQADDRTNGQCQLAGPRIGFTVTKRLGNAVTRNRIRRRLKAALQQIANGQAKDHFDYVLIAREAALIMVLGDLVGQLEKAFDRVHHPPKKTKRAAKRPAKDKATTTMHRNDPTSSPNIPRN